MKVVASVVVGALVVVVLCGALGVRGEASPAGAELKSNPVTKQVQRQEVFEFTQKPRVTKVGDKYVITFASKGKCDATVAVMAPDGKVVRHLASGVLGENAPWPFKQSTLTQVLEWDGKTDAGKPAPAGCKIRVSLGLKPVFDKVFGWGGAMHTVKGMAVGSRGQLYVLGGHTGRGGNSVFVCVFDAEGRYLRTIMPHPATVPPERMTLIEWTQTTWGDLAMCRVRQGGGQPFDRYRYPHLARGLPSQSPAITPDGRFVFISGYVIPGWGIGVGTPPCFQGVAGRKLIFLDTRDGAAPPGSGVDADQGVQREAGVLSDGRIFMTVSPDGKWLYLGGAAGNPDWKRMETHGISRISLEKPGLAERLIGEYGTPGKDNAHFNQPRGVACDKAGNLYVADYGNDRIQVFKPDGSHFKTLSLQKPEQLAVHPRTGAIYVLQALPLGPNFYMVLVKLGGLNNPAVRAALELPLSQHRVTYTIALDATSDPPAVWVAADRLWRVEDRGDRFAKVLNVQEQNKPQEGWENWQGGNQQPYIVADPFREELYVREHGGIVYGSPVLRVDGRTGKVIERLEEPIEQVLGVGPDRLVYMRFVEYERPRPKWLARYDPDARKYLPFPEGEPPGRRPERLKEKVPVGPWFPHNLRIGGRQVFAGARRSYQDQSGVAPNGDVYVLAGPLPEQVAALEKEGLPRPSPKSSSVSRLLQVFSADGKLKVLSALPGLCGGTHDMSCLQVRVGRGGAVYLAGMYHPVGQKVPDGIAPDGKCLPTLWGTLVKFNSSFGKFPVGSITGSWEEKLEGKPTHYVGGWKLEGKPIRMENMLWDYGGIAPLVQEGCTCEASSFDLDQFERVFVPAVQTASVNVLDANGNLILRVGKYGNADSRGRDSAVPEPDLAFIFPRFVTTTDEAMYVDDEENHRIVRALLGYETEETVGLGTPR